VHRIYQYLITLPDNVERMTMHELLLCATMLTLVVTVVLMISGRKLT
jgi:hypothetical protein